MREERNVTPDSCHVGACLSRGICAPLGVKSEDRVWPSCVAIQVSSLQTSAAHSLWRSSCFWQVGLLDHKKNVCMRVPERNRDRQLRGEIGPASQNSPSRNSIKELGGGAGTGPGQLAQGVWTNRFGSQGYMCGECV